MPFYDFKCTCGHELKDQMVKMGTETMPCPKCSEIAKKQLSYRFSAHGLPNGHIGTRISSR